MKLSAGKKRKLTKHLQDRRVKQMLGGMGSGGSAPVGGRKVPGGDAAAGTYAAAAVKKSPALQKLRTQKNDPSRSPEMFKQQLEAVEDTARGRDKAATQTEDELKRSDQMLQVIITLLLLIYSCSYTLGHSRVMGYVLRPALESVRVR